MIDRLIFHNIDQSVQHLPYALVKKIKKQAQEAPFASVLMEINSKLGETPAIKNKVDSLCWLRRRLTRWKIRSVQSKQSDEVLSELKRQSTENAVLKKKVEQVEADNPSQEVRKLQQQVNSLEQFSRR